MDEFVMSLLLFKFFNEVEYGGGVKMEWGDIDYIFFLFWIEDFKKLVGNEYVEVEDLFDISVWNGSEIWLRIFYLFVVLFGEIGLFMIYVVMDCGWCEELFVWIFFNVCLNFWFGVFV